MALKHTKLSDEDRCSIDVILDRRAGDARTIGALSARCFSKGNLATRVQTIERVFDLLGQMPAGDPPANLVARTLRFVKKHSHTRPIVGPVSHHIPHQPPSTAIRYPSHRVLH